jgi:hypothetical protein
MGLRFRQWVRVNLGARSDEVTVVIPWRAPIRALLVTSAFAIVWGRIWTGGDSAWPAGVAGWAAVASVGGVAVSRSTARHRVVVTLDFLVLIIAPDVAVRILPGTYRHEWYAIYPASFAASILVVYSYVALSRLPGFGPLASPADEPPQPLAARLWTPDQRVVRLGPSSRTVFRRTYPLVFNGLAFAFLTLVTFGLAVGVLSDHIWIVGVIAALVCLFFGRTAVRALRVAVIADADGVMVRNLQRTRRVPWGDVRRIVPPSADDYRYLRIDRLHGGPIRCTALAKSVFQRKHALDHCAGELAALVGPGPEPVRS